MSEGRGTDEEAVGEDLVEADVAELDLELLGEGDAGEEEYKHL